MNSAIGNFDNSGKRVEDEQTPENGYSVGTTSAKVALPSYYTLEKQVNTLASKVVSLEDELRRLNIAPVVTDTYNINVFDYISNDDWSKLCALMSAMLANGMVLYELEQRIMGLA